MANDEPKTVITASQWKVKQQFVAEQLQQMQNSANPFVTCSCGKNLNPHDAYRCLYCGEWFCQQCAEIHFGKTIDQYRKEHPIVEDPLPRCSGYGVFPGGEPCNGCKDCMGEHTVS